MKTSGIKTAAGLADALQTARIHQGLKTRFMGRKIYLFEELDSTNEAALYLARSRSGRPDSTVEGDVEGDLVLAESQTRGKGRLGRRWVSPPGVNLYASFILRPSLEASQAPLLTALAAVSLVRAIEEQCGLRPGIKWPNDVLVRGKKTAGVLTEMGTQAGRVDHVVVGLGVNVNLALEALPDDVRPRATSLLEETGRQVDRNALAAALCNHLEEQYLDLQARGPEALQKALRPLLETLGKRVRIELSDRVLTGWAEDLQEDGALVLRLNGGRREIVRSGDVTHLREEES